MATFESAFSAARSRTSTRRTCASGCSRTGMWSARRDADVAVVNTCCVTNEALSKSRQAAARAARSHQRVYVTGCGANLEGDHFAGLPQNVVVVRRRSEETPAAVAADLGALGCVQDDARLERVRAFVKIQDGCSFSCNFCVIPLVRGGTRSRTRRRGASRGPAPRRAGAPRDRAHRDQPRLLSRPRGRLHARAARPRGRRDPGARAPAALVDRDQPRRRRPRRRRSAKRRRSRAICTCRFSPATTACCARWDAATRPRRTCGASSHSTTSISPPT